MLISFDPNLREPLWKDLEEARTQIDHGMRYCDVLKISDNEILWFTGESNYDMAAEKLYRDYKIPVIFVTADPFLNPDTIETTGAGDTFGACALHYLLEIGIEGLGEEQAKGLLQFANAAASLITTRKGALRVMPKRTEIEELIRTRTH